MGVRVAAVPTIACLALMGAMLPLVAGCSFLDRQSDMSDAGPTAAGNDFESAMTRGKAHFAKGQFGLALGAFKKALDQQPESVRALDAVAASYDKLQRYDLADHYYGLAIERAPNSPDLLNNIGYSHELRGDYAGARRYLARAAGLDPTSKVIGGNLAMLQPPAAGPSTGEAGSTPDGAIPAPQSPAAPPPLAAALPGEHRPRIERVAQGVQMLVTLPAPAKPALDLASRSALSPSTHPTPLAAVPSVAAPVAAGARGSPAQTGAIAATAANPAPLVPRIQQPAIVTPPLLALRPGEPANQPRRPRPEVEVDLSAIDGTPGLMLRPPPERPTTVVLPSRQPAVTVDLRSLD